MSLTDKKKKAKALKITLKEDATEEQIDVLIKEAEDKKELEAEQARIEKENKQKLEDEKKKSNIVLKDTDGNDVDQKDYFFPDIEKKITDTAPTYFNHVCGNPVDREDLLEVFNSIFRKDKKFLFYRMRDKEVYLIIIPLKYATTISKSNESIPGDFQKHALSFITEGSVNLDSLKAKLVRIAKHPSISTEALA